MPVELTYADRDLINRVVATEADHRLAKTNPDAYFSQVAGIVDTILNRVASPEYPDTVAEVIDQKGQFSAINGPSDRGYKVWGSVSKVPDSVVPAPLPDMVGNYLNQRIDGRPSSVGGNLNYANPKYSDASNQGWIEALDGPRYGDGDAIHYHGTTKGSKPVEAVLVGDAYDGKGVKLPPGSIPDTGVGTLLDVRPGAEPQTYRPGAAVAARTNRMLDRVDPAPRAQGTAARTNAMLQRDEETRGMPLPRARPDEAPGLQPAQTNPTDGARVSDYQYTPAGLPRDPDNAFLLDKSDPRYAAAIAASPNANVREQAPAAAATPAGKQATLPAIGPTGGPSLQPPGMKPAAQPAPTAAAPAAIAAPQKYITTYEKKEIPLGDVSHGRSRDSIASAKAGAAAAEDLRIVNRTVTTLNPEWVKTQTAPKPADRAKPEDQPGLGEQIVGSIRSAVGIPEEGFGPGIVRGARSAVGLPAEGIGTGIMGSIRSAIGIPADGLGPGIMRGVQSMATGIGRPQPRLSTQQIQGARSNASNHNAAALAAISRGEKGYTSSDGSVQPTTAMNGKVRNTYGD